METMNPDRIFQLAESGLYQKGMTDSEAPSGEKEDVEALRHRAKDGLTGILSARRKLMRPGFLLGLWLFHWFSGYKAV